MKLLLFDIDGTLIHSNGAGRVALVAALEEVVGTAGAAESYPFNGKTDPRIITDLLTAAGFDETHIQTQLPAIYERMAEQGKIHFWQKQMSACPGVMPMLEVLRQQKEVVLGLLTGNIAATAPLKLAASGLDPTWFVVGAYGSDHIDRNCLPAIAMQRATALTGRVFTGRDTVIIGDTPADILCARAGQTTAVAVATGRHSAETLRQYEPDYLFTDLSDTTAVLHTLIYLP